MTISSSPNFATVYIDDVEVGKTPLAKSLKRNKNYSLVLKLDGYHPYRVAVNKKFNEWYLGNILIGGVIGLVIDPITGAMYRLTPNELNANLNAQTASTTSVGDTVRITVQMEIDPDWQQVGQMVKTD